MLAGGARAVNVAEPLVFYRVGPESFKRRGGTGLLRSELRLQREFRRRGFTSPLEFVRNVLVRGGYRLIPWWCRRAVYRPIVAHFTGQPAPAAAEADLAPAAAAVADAGPGDAELACCPAEGEWEYPEMPAARFWREQPLPVGS